MGGRISTAYRAEKVKMHIFNEQLEEEFRDKYRLLLLGSSGSGKSTLLNQIKITHRGGFSTSELAEFRPIVYENVLESAQAVITYMRKNGLECADIRKNIYCDNICDYTLDAAPGSPQNPYFSPDIADAIHRLWKDPVVAKIINKHFSKFHLMDNADYFFSEVLRIAMPDYLPNEEDVLRAHRKNVGTTETKFSMGLTSLRLIDIGEPYDSRKWLHCFEGVTSIMFCAAVSDYDQVLVGEKSQNRLNESILLFESVVNSPWFSRTSVILLFTKIDVFANKLPKAPLERYFPEYTGGEGMSPAMKYILWRFMLVNRARLRVYPHITQTTKDTTSVRLLFSAVNQTILQNELKDRNIL